MSQNRFEDDTEVELLARLILGEARDQPLLGQICVANVVRNRVNNPCWWGETYKEVILKPKQFTCFNEDDNNYPVVRHARSNRLWESALTIAEMVIEGWVSDFTDGATHYNTIKCEPWWEEKLELIKVVGNHEFFK